MPTQPNLVSAARSGDAEAFDELIGAHLETGYRVALAILRNPDEAHDALQDSAFKAWRRLGQLKDGRAARAWFLTIVANQCRSVRRGRWWSVVRLPSVDRSGADFETASAQSTDLQRLLADLPAEDRLPLFLHFYLDLPLEEVAAAILITVAIVAGLMSVRLAQRQVPGRPSPPTSSPAPLADYGPPPVGVPLIYLAYLHRPGWLVGFDWSGKPRGTVKLAQPPD